MKVRVDRNMRDAKYYIRFLPEEFTDEEIYLLSKHGPLYFSLPQAYFQMKGGSPSNGTLRITHIDLPTTDFWFTTSDQAKEFCKIVLGILRKSLEDFVSSAIEFVGDEVFEVRVGEEVRRINEGARKALQKDSEEYREVIERNRDAFEKLSKL